MPYIKAEERTLLDGGSAPQTVGHLTYLYTKAILEARAGNALALLEITTFDWLILRGHSFKTFAQILGALTATELEWYRRMPALTPKGFGAPALWSVRDFRQEFYDTIVAPYEDRKIAENGDVYPT